jgi:hypothetical protein
MQLIISTVVCSNSDLEKIPINRRYCIWIPLNTTDHFCADICVGSFKNSALGPGLKLFKKIKIFFWTARQIWKGSAKVTKSAGTVAELLYCQVFLI